MTTHHERPLRRLAAIGLGAFAALAVTIAGHSLVGLAAWPAVAVGVLVGCGVCVGLEVWDDTAFPDVVVTSRTRPLQDSCSHR